MLTRLRVSGFKNLVDADVHFGPFTCIAGPNGVGKSNLFDAIRFLSALADRTLIDAAKSIREEASRTGDIRALFHRVGDKIADRMRFEAEIIVPPHGTDDLGQPATAQATFLRYTVELGDRRSETESGGGALELIKEELTYIRSSDARQRLWFPHSVAWRESAVKFRNRKSPFISTDGDGADRKVLLHQEGVQGRPTPRPAHQLPRTVLSATNASESPTALLARREMQSWRLLQLEPTSLRKPDEFSAPTRLSPDGLHLPASLFRLAREVDKSNGRDHPGHATAYARVATRLQELIQDVRTVRVDRDEKRELLSLVATDKHGTQLPARALSDGTLRFLALSVLELDAEAVGVICFEEPENGIHPDRIPAMLRLLSDIAIDPSIPVSADNPLRQVIVNTHSPLVVGGVKEGDLLAAVAEEGVREGTRLQKATFQALPGTWRMKLADPPRQIALGTLMSYLNPVAARPEDRPAKHDPVGNGTGKRVRRVRDRDDVRSLFDGLPAEV